MFIIIPISPQHPDALLLFQAAAVEVRQIYADLISPQAPPPTNEPSVAGSAYFGVNSQNQPIGSIALHPLEPGVSEVRRMFILPEFRRQGLARALPEVIEQKALKLWFPANSGI